MNTTRLFPELDPDAIGPTRDALHACARVLGEYLTAYRPKRKHWWHLSLQPSLEGFKTAVIHADTDFELELDLMRSVLCARTRGGTQSSISLKGQSAFELAKSIQLFLNTHDLSHLAITPNPAKLERSTFAYSAAIARSLGDTWRAIGAAMAEFRAGIREETSPIQLWPHHFDLAMMWLPGDKIHGQDPDDEENADKQMNFGFTMGDRTIAEPYFYVTAYPMPDSLSKLSLPPGANWHAEGFSGALLRYRSLVNVNDPEDFLLEFWNNLLRAGRDHMNTPARP